MEGLEVNRVPVGVVEDAPERAVLVVAGQIHRATGLDVRSDVGVVGNRQFVVALIVGDRRKL